MNTQLIRACEAFSSGKPEAAIALLAEPVEWRIVGDRTIKGRAAVKTMCEDAAAQGAPNFKNGRVIQAKHHVIVEGGDRDSDLHYCDIFTVEDGAITEITSYSLTAAE